MSNKTPSTDKKTKGVSSKSERKDQRNSTTWRQTERIKERGVTGLPVLLQYWTRLFKLWRYHDGSISEITTVWKKGGQKVSEGEREMAGHWSLSTSKCISFIWLFLTETDITLGTLLKTDMPEKPPWVIFTFLPFHGQVITVLQRH